MSPDEEPRSITRRGWVRGAVAAAAVVAFGGSVKMAFGDECTLHPPGAQDRARFASLCIRCDRCRSACPTGAIGVAKLEDGVLEARMPKMEFRLAWCDTCDGAYRCIAACPTGALDAFDPGRDKIGLAVVDASSCQLYTYAKKCNKPCIDACPAGAVSQNADGGLTVDADACWGCGACEYVCPTNAYRTYDGNPSRGLNVKAVEEVRDEGN